MSAIKDGDVVCAVDQQPWLRGYTEEVEEGVR
jgi:hypothetical protein